jgi:hypothetical protein
MGRKPLTAEQRKRRRAYVKAWRAVHREHCIAYDKRQRQKCRERRRADNARATTSLDFHGKEFP